MSVAGVMLVKDEADVVGYTIDHLLTQVDEVYVFDNLSSDGTSGILAAIDDRVHVYRDDEPGYYQDTKTTALARRALDDGHSWVVPCDADEVWYSTFGRVADLLEQLDPQYLFAKASLYYHLPTPRDPADWPNPLARIGWRFREPQGLPKVACRLVPTLRIGMGNHEASVVSPTRVSSTGQPPTREAALAIRHFPWRTEEQLVRKITNGYRAYAAAPERAAMFGDHWRAFGPPESEGFEERVREWFRLWGSTDAPRGRTDLIYDPAPLGRREEQ